MRKQKSSQSSKISKFCPKMNGRSPTLFVDTGTASRKASTSAWRRRSCCRGSWMPRRSRAARCLRMRSRSCASAGMTANYRSGCTHATLDTCQWTPANGRALEASINGSAPDAVTCVHAGTPRWRGPKGSSRSLRGSRRVAAHRPSATCAVRRRSVLSRALQGSGKRRTTRLNKPAHSFSSDLIDALCGRTTTCARIGCI